MINKKLALIVLLCLALAVSLYFNFAHTTPSYDKNLVKQREDSLLKQNTQLKQDIFLEQYKNKTFLSQIDSLQSAKQKSKLVIKTKYYEIDHYHARMLVHDFDSVFTKHGIKNR